MHPKLTRALVAALAVAAIPLSTPGTARAAFPGANGKIAYQIGFPRQVPSPASHVKGAAR
jgi:hypothetical protein